MEQTPQTPKKPFDLKDLQARLLDKGLQPAKDGAERIARGAIEAVFAWAREGVELSPNKYDDLSLSVLRSAEKWLLTQADLIDGKPGQ